MISQARDSAALWRLILGTLTAAAGLAAWLFAVLGAVALLEGVSIRDAARMLFGRSADMPQGALSFLLVVAGLAFGTVIAARVWHRRSLRSLAGPGPRTLRHFVVAALVTWAVIGVGAALTFASSETVGLNMPVSAWLIWLVPGLLGVALQTGAEELFFRGYLQSQVAARFRSPLIWLPVPALAFGLAHYSGGLPGSIAWAYVAFATIFGILAGDLLARTGSLGAAWGFHFANNAFAVLVVATEGTISGLGLFVNSVPLTAIDPLDPLLILELFPLFLAWWLIGRILTR